MITMLKKKIRLTRAHAPEHATSIDRAPSAPTTPAFFSLTNHQANSVVDDQAALEVELTL